MTASLDALALKMVYLKMLSTEVFIQFLTEFNFAVLLSYSESWSWTHHLPDSLLLAVDYMSVPAEPSSTQALWLSSPSPGLTEASLNLEQLNSTDFTNSSEDFFFPEEKAVPEERIFKVD